jgi:hypothetical protein
VSDYDPRFNDPLIAKFEAILREDIPDPNRRRAVAMMIHAHAKAAMVHSIRDKFDPFIGMNAVKPTVEEALTAMRGAIIRIAGFDRGRTQEGDSGVGSGVGDDRNDQGDH